MTATASALMSLWTASTFYQNLRDSIDEFQFNLEPTEDFQIEFYTTDGKVILVAGIGYQNPSLIRIDGIDSKGQEILVLAHVNSVQVHLRKVITTSTSGKKTGKIGFRGEVKPKNSSSQQSDAE